MPVKQPQKPESKTKRTNNEVNKTARKQPPVKQNQSSTQEPKKQEKEKKSGSFAKKFFGFIFFLVLVAVGYLAYQIYEGSKANNTDFISHAKTVWNDKDEQQKIWDTTKNDANTISNKTKEYSKIALDKASEYSDIALEKSKEYKDVIANFSKESFKDIEEKVKKFGAKSTEELSNMADKYLEASETKETEFVVEKYKGKDMNELLENEKKKSDQLKKDSEMAKAKQEEITKQEEVAKQETIDNQKVATAKSEETKTVAKDITNLPPPEKKFVTPEKKEGPGFKIKQVTAGEKNQDAVDKPAETNVSTKITKSSKPTESTLPAEYVEGRTVFLEALKYYKKSMPGMPQENQNRKKAFYLFKKATNHFANVSNKMEGNPEYDEMSVDAYRFMHGCGKSMLINEH